MAVNENIGLLKPNKAPYSERMSDKLSLGV